MVCPTLHGLISARKHILNAPKGTNCKLTVKRSSSVTDLLQLRVCTPVSQSGHKANSVSRCFSNPQMSAGGTFYRAWNFCGILDISMGVYGDILDVISIACVCTEVWVSFFSCQHTLRKKYKTKKCNFDPQYPTIFSDVFWLLHYVQVWRFLLIENY